MKSLFFSLLCLLASLHAEVVTQPPAVTPATPQTPTAVPTSPSSTPATMPSYEGTLLKMFLTLGGLIFLALVTVWLLKRFAHGRFGGLGSQKKISILEKKHLSPKTALYLVELEGKKILLSESQLEVKMIQLSQESELYDE